MVPRLRHRIGIETLRRELDAVQASSIAAANNSTHKHHRNRTSTSSSSSTSTTVTVEDSAWTTNGHLSIQPEIANGYTQKHHNNAAVGDKIPGYRTSAAFLSSLRTNLHLHASPPPSPMSTPPSMRASASSLPDGIYEASALANDTGALTPPQTPTNPLEGIPDLTTYTATSDDEKIAALKLVSDSIAQMRQTASSILIYHPANIGVFIVFLGVVCQKLYHGRSDIGIVFTTAAGLTMAALIFVRWLTGGYIFAAEDYSQQAAEVLDGADVIVTKFGEEIIGTVILGWKGVEPGKAGSPKDSQKGKRRKWRAEIRGWAVRVRYRGKGCGADLLEEAVQVAKGKGAESVTFAEDHANSKRILWSYYNGAFEKKERLAREKLQALWDANPKSKKK